MQDFNKQLEQMTMRSMAHGPVNSRIYKPSSNGSPTQSGVTSTAFSEGNRNFCHKHKKKYVNFCLDHAVALCAACFKDHQGHKIEMLENYAQAEVSKLQSLVEHLEASIRHVKEKLELRKNLNEKKEIAAKQFFELTFNELKRIEEEFWEKFSKDQGEEVDLFSKLLDQQDQMEKQYFEIRPLFDAMEEKIGASEFYDIIESKAYIWNLNETFKKSKTEFYELVTSAEDYELVFDKIECRRKLEQFLKEQLAIKMHQHEIIEVREKAIYYYQPFKGSRRKVNIDDDKLTQQPTLLNTKETGRLLIIGGNSGYSSSRKCYQVDECMNMLNLHSKLNLGRVGHAAVYINNKDIYVIGGYNSTKNQWIASVETCYDAFNPDQKPEWQMMAEMNEARYYFGCCTWNNEFIFVFGGMNDRFMEQQMSEHYSKCLNSIERYSVECNRWDRVDLKTYQKFPFCSHIVAVHLQWDKDRIIILGGQTYNKKTQNFENIGIVFKFDPIDEKLKECKNLDTQDRFIMCQGISDGSKLVAAIGENNLHLFDGTTWKVVPKE